MFIIEHMFIFVITNQTAMSFLLLHRILMCVRWVEVANC